MKLKSIARALYNLSLDMDFADYAEHAEDDIECITKELQTMNKNGCNCTLQALETIATEYEVNNFWQEIRISKEALEHINTLLSMTGKEIYQKYGYKMDETFTYTATFPDAMVADIKLVICGEDEKPYTEGVLFHHELYEVGHTDCEDTFERVWCFEYYGTHYMVNVVAE